MKVVRFEDGTFGVRRWSLFMLQFVYRDFKTTEFWWTRNSQWFISDCRGTEHQARAFLDKGTPIK